jgi:hypothetical protein
MNMTLIPTWNVFSKKAALLCWALWLCGFAATAQTAGLYIEFPDDETALTCHYHQFSNAQLKVLPLGNAVVGISYEDQVFFSLPDTCLKILRTWRAIDGNTYDPNLPLVTVPNPAGAAGPTVSSPSAPATWEPSQIGGVNYANFWSATANGYQYTQVISSLAQPHASGLFIRFPRDIVANNCDPLNNAEWGSPEVIALGTSQYQMTYSDQVFNALPNDTCFKIIRTWTIMDWTAPSIGPNIFVSNPPSLVGPTVSASGTDWPWQPSAFDVFHLNVWSPWAQSYTYQQVISSKASAATGLYVRFPADVVVPSCDPVLPANLPEPQVLKLSNELVSVGFADVVLNSPPDGCRRIERTWHVLDWNTYNSALPFVTVPNPANWQPGPTVSAPTAQAPWRPSIIGGTNYSTLWSAAANGYEYKQIITYTPLKCPNDTVLAALPPACTAPLDYTVEAQSGWSFFQTAGLPSGASFPLGTTLNEFQASGTTIKCSFKVTVKDLTPPAAHCQILTTVSLGADDPQDCYSGAVKWAPVSQFDDGSTDDCGGNVRLTVRRTIPYTDCIQFHNGQDGMPPCDDTDGIISGQESEFERAITEKDSIKFYCCEAGTVQRLLLRAYQLNPDGSVATDLKGYLISSQCMTTVRVLPSPCGDTVPSLSGYVLLDTDLNCTPDLSQIGLPGMVLKMLDSAGDTLYASSGLQGHYRFAETKPGAAVLEVLPPVPFWNICQNPDTLDLPATGQSFHDFSAQPIVECPVLTLDLATDLLRPCRASSWYATYCNLGGSAATGAYVQIVAAHPLQLLSASKPFAFSGDTLTVQVGDVAVGACGGFSIRVETPCDADIIGSELCIEAHIFPDTLCAPPASAWSGAQMEVEALCEGDSVRFTLRNTGTAPTAQSLDYVIIDDMVIMLQGQVPPGFAPGATIQHAVPSQGELLRLRSEQEPHHPTAQPPSVAVQNCNGATQPSLLLEFENEDGSSFSDLECREVVASFDPNEKLAFPRGFSPQHLIEAETRLTYQINFQNTGTDTAFLVVLRDTLSPLLDPATIRVGAGSHPYTWSLSGKGILEFRFENILLPDSTSNEAASHGFVQFYMDQKPGNAIGSRIENRAGIYFDIVNPVVLTNTVWHTVGKDFVATSSVKNPAAADALRIFPNPAAESAFVVLEGEKTAQIRLLDVYGRRVRSFSGKTPGVQLRREGLPSGVYFVEISDGRGWQSAGRLVWR